MTCGGFDAHDLRYGPRTGREVHVGAPRLAASHGPQVDSICVESFVTLSRSQSMVESARNPRLVFFFALCSSLNCQCRTGRLLCSWPRSLYCASMLYDRNRRCSSVLLPERQHPCCRPSAGTLLSRQHCCWLPSRRSHRASERS